MPNLHVHLGNANVKAFKQELDGTATAQPNGGGWKAPGSGIGPGSASGGKSWSMSGMSGVPVKADINERDQYGRTVLHLAASSLTPIAYTFLGIILRHPSTAVNLQDTESGYTALHRALFVGNIRAARDLLARSDVDTLIKDSEGMTAFDLYNGTVEGTNPPHDVDGSDLYVWGVNRNFSLGTGDSSDKAFPDHINLLTQAQASGRVDPAHKFDHVGVQDVVMAKLHTGVITTESRGNLSLCGFGSNGRLGRSVHSQLSLVPLPDLSHSIVSIALGQDHTLALASGGYVLSWGHNRFSQLGYVIEAPEKPLPGGRDDDLVQTTPKRIVGPLKKEWVKGVAAGRLASACWTADGVWTWGTNAGQLGYDKASNPVQVIPRRVTSITQPVLDIAFSDYAMICLLDTSEVLCFHRDTSFKIGFSTPRVLSEAFPFRPPQATLKPLIRKVTSCGTSFAALSSIGDVFTFSLPNPLEDLGKDARGGHVTVKPQMIWALRKSFTAVKDVALGSDGTVIICTHSGHVFVRQRLKSGSGQLKFRPIPYLQRVIKVATNESGAFAAIRVDAKATPIVLTGKTLEEDLFLLQPHIRRFEAQMSANEFEESLKHKQDEDDEDESSNSVSKDLSVAMRLCTILTRWRSDQGDSLFSWSDPLLGSDIHLVIRDLAIPAHSVLLALRVPKLKALLGGKGKSDRLTLGKFRSARAVHVKACHPLVGLLLLQYIYSDDIAAIWDPRVARAIQDKFGSLKLQLADIKSDLRALAEELDLAPLATVLSSAGKQPIPQPTLPSDIQTFFKSTHGVAASPSTQCDVTVLLADREVSCNSTILRARCPFFEAMFADDDWTVRRKEQGRVVVSMTHLRSRPMDLVFRYIHEGAEDDLFDYLHQETLDELLDFVFEVLAAATELLLDRLVLVCSRVIAKHCNAFNAAALATEAAFYQATTLKLSIFDYIISCMETMLESGLLDEMDTDVLLDLGGVIAQKQRARLSVSRSQVLVKLAMEKHREWLSLQDIPQARVRQPFRWKSRSPALSPVDALAFTSTSASSKRQKAPQLPLPSPLPTSPILSPELQPDRSSAADGIFQMDDEYPTPPLATSGAATPRPNRPMTPLDLSAGSKGPVWRSKTVETEKVDLRSIMAEAAAKKAPTSAPTRLPLTPSTALAGARQPPSGAPTPAKTPSSAGTPGGPWRPTEVRKTSLSSVQAAQSPPSAGRPTVSASGAGPQASSSPSISRATSSRIMTPSKVTQPSPSSSSFIGPSSVSTPSRKISGGAAWSTPTTFAPLPPPPPTAAVSTSPTASFSLLAIQQHERDIAEQSAKKPTKSLVQIQEEEKRAEVDKAQEEEFMRWWAEEEARVAKEGSSTTSGNGNAAAGGKGRNKGKTRVATTKGKGGKAAAGAGGGDGEGGAPKRDAHKGNGAGAGVDKVVRGSEATSNGQNKGRSTSKNAQAASPAAGGGLTPTKRSNRVALDTQAQAGSGAGANGLNGSSSSPSPLRPMQVPLGTSSPPISISAASFTPRSASQPFVPRGMAPPTQSQSQSTPQAPQLHAGAVSFVPRFGAGAGAGAGAGGN